MAECSIALEAEEVTNPWDARGSALGINLGDPARVLTYARKHGVLSEAGDQLVG